MNKKNIILLFFIFYIQTGCYNEIQISHPQILSEITEKNEVENHIIDSVINKIKPDTSSSTGWSRPPLAKVKRSYRFEDFTTPIYNGALATPDFRGNPFADDEEYVEFITRGCENNAVNFAGHYTILLRGGCGTMCLRLFIIDRIDGKIYIEIETNGKYGFEYRNNSTLLIANSESFVNNNFIDYPPHWPVPEFYEWWGEDFRLLE